MAAYIPDPTEDELTRRYLEDRNKCVICGKRHPLDEWGYCPDCAQKETERVDDGAY